MSEQEDNLRECAALIKVACPLCTAPAGSHCANHSNTIVWPPHLCRMDAYTHRLDPSEDWPVQTYAGAEPPQHVRNIPTPPLSRPALHEED